MIKHFRDSARPNCVLVIDFSQQTAAYAFQAMHAGEPVGMPRAGAYVFADAMALITAPKSTWKMEKA